MNPQTMTCDQCRDELARMDGWKRVYAEGFTKEDGYECFKWQLRHHQQWDHPHPPTLDGAAKALPEGWWWMRDGAATSHRPDGLLLKWTACERGADNWRIVETPDTGDEIADRYRLALACRREMEKTT